MVGQHFFFRFVVVRMGVACSFASHTDDFSVVFVVDKYFVADIGHTVKVIADGGFIWYPGGASCKTSVGVKFYLYLISVYCRYRSGHNSADDGGTGLVLVGGKAVAASF